VPVVDSTVGGLFPFWTGRFQVGSPVVVPVYVTVFAWALGRNESKLQTSTSDQID
jgi:hypothetical protein